MFRQIVATILLLAFVAQAFDKVAIVVDYYTNTAAYLRECVNKARPYMHCNGKCQMMKKLKEEEKKEQENTERRMGLNEVISSKSFFLVTVPCIVTFIQRIYAHYNTEHPVDRAYTIFHPPGLV